MIRERDGKNHASHMSTLAAPLSRSLSRSLPVRSYVLLAATLLLTLMLLEAPAYADGGRAGLVVQFADGALWTGCIDLGGDSLSGAEVLDRSGLTAVLDYGSGLGAAVCKIENDGCDFPLQGCFCQCEGLDCRYWAYYHLQTNGEWQYSQVGGSGYTVHDGDVEGWAWGPGNYGVNGVVPPVFTFDQLCAPPTATPTATPLPATPTPTATSTSPVTATPTATPWPTVTPTMVLPTGTATPTPTEAPLTVAYSIGRGSLSRGECTEVSWMVDGALEVYWSDGLAETGVTGQEVRQVCPTASQEYTLRVVAAAGEETRSLRIEVSEPTPTAKPVLATQDAVVVQQQQAAAPMATVAPATSTPQPTATEEVDVAPVSELSSENRKPAPTSHVTESEEPEARNNVVESGSAPESSAAKPTVAAVALLPRANRVSTQRAGDSVSQQRADPLMERVFTDVQEEAEVRSIPPLSSLPGYAVFAFLASALCLAAIVVLRRPSSGLRGAASHASRRRL